MFFSPTGFHSRMLKKSASVVSCRSEVQRTEAYASPLCSLRPSLGQGASWRARVGRVRRLAFLNILLTLLTVEYESIHA